MMLFPMRKKRNEYLHCSLVCCKVSSLPIGHRNLPHGFFFYGFLIMGILLSGFVARAKVPQPSGFHTSCNSSLQRSSFFLTKPEYEKKLETRLSHRRSLLLWKLRFDSQSLETAQNIHSRNVGGSLHTKFRYKVIDKLHLKAKASLNLESGRSQSIFGDLEPGSGIYPREIKLQWKPFGNLMTFGFGQIHQAWFNERLFLGNLGFPGLSEKWSYQYGRLNIDLIGQQLIPTSSTLSTRVAQRESVPYLFTESLQAYFKVSHDNFIKGRLTHYKYTNLPAIVAFESFIYGNTVEAPDRNNARFMYDFEGLMTQLAFEQKLGFDLSAQIQWNTIKNMKAPDTHGEAQSLRFWVGRDFGSWLVIGSYTNYFIEPDAVPAFYNSFRLGHNNRIGQSYQLSFESRDWGVNFKAHYTDANLLNFTTQRVDGLQQDNQQTFYFSMETLYDFI